MQTSQTHIQQGTTRHALARQNNVDPFHGYENRDFCNVFWGPGDTGLKVLFSRMASAEKTMGELRDFWKERWKIELEYAQKLEKLSRFRVGDEETGELRASLKVLCEETQLQAKGHRELAQKMSDDLENPTSHFLEKLMTRRKQQVSVDEKLRNRLTQETYAAKAREKWENDRNRINELNQKLEDMASTEDRRGVLLKLSRTKQTAEATEVDFAKFNRTLVGIQQEWESEWTSFCDMCQDMEEERMEFLKDIMWTYANDVSTLCVSDDQSCEKIRMALDLFDPERDVHNFAETYGTGNELPRAPPPLSSDQNESSSAPGPQYAVFSRKSNRRHSYTVEAMNPAVPQLNGSPNPHVQGHSLSQATVPQAALPELSHGPVPPPPPTTIPPQIPDPISPPTVLASPGTSRPNRTSSVRARTALPGTPHVNSHDIPQANMNVTTENNKILFYVEAMYDYRATIDEEFDFQAGDIIAVTAAPEDGWWSGELLDEARRVEGKNIFPMNFTRLF